jgi:methylenetetrahydrofolate dehydrogenase (NADP+)/methenyltetrahydrofolate cyclohydrolase
MKKVDGKKIAERIKEEIKNLLLESGPKSLAIVYVGENPVIDNYVSLKKRVGEELGISVEVLRFDAGVKEAELVSAMTGATTKYSGMIVQLPLPESLDKEKILNAVPTKLDVDVLSAGSFQMFANGLIHKLPPVVSAVTEIVREYDIDLTDKKIVVVGQGALVGRPVSAWLTREGFTHQIFEKGGDIAMLLNADVIITGAGVPGLVTPDMVKEGSILIDAGTSTSSGKIAGDIDPEAYDKASLVSGVPGGVGPITVVSLFRNLFL